MRGGSGWLLSVLCTSCFFYYQRTLVLEGRGDKEGEIRKGMPGLQHHCPIQPFALQPTSLTPNSYISSWSFASFEIQLKSQHLQKALILCPPKAHNTYFRIFNKSCLILTPAYFGM